MGKLILVTGGARSGKSTFSENTAKALGERILYIATCIPFDDEMKLRVKKHREQRPVHWETVEAYKHLDVVLKERSGDKSGVLLDCVTIMVTNLLMDSIPDWETMDEKQAIAAETVAKQEVDRLISAAARLSIPVIAVTNEVGMGIVPEYPSARLFRDIAGRVNQMLAAAADEVYLCVSGIPVRIK